MANITVLEAAGLEPIIVNAQHIKTVPGRKTDVKDAEWIADLLQHGLLRASFIPDRAQRELRELVSYRKSLIKEQTAELNRIQKMLEGGNIKLSGTIANINGKSGRSLLESILAEEKLDAAKSAAGKAPSRQGAVRRRRSVRGLPHDAG